MNISKTIHRAHPRRALNWAGLVAALVLGGCSAAPQLYEGTGGYRFIGAKTPPPGKESLPETWRADWEDKYQNPKQRSKLKGKFQEGDTLSIYLKSASFSHITEDPIKRAWADHVRKTGKVKGEIAIIATDKGPEATVSPTDASNPGRVIFYSGDVEEGQMVNLSFGPGYGPVKWNGGPIVLDVTVLQIVAQDSLTSH
ncbi:hypothetical protein [Thauera linaloolentis]|uniref:Lipoprotein n=1 Tax=Thauera linaloolentis (strain DSM 12138 / JCM 21573 / CCUG 41526 / CIP 105981 / IAM 15112 / NBRC 102519 / 47Lol) TaxID=1123367 RepID=N6YDA6_THAL4|nr:hypothetical protein [Thauera linaloolentis]ENO89515.1 hypothetical protein C666_05665 [Thauera linaloolentis 47Lol = DSM 12138]MCM8565410.1 hypothetical protein [Thauera linaloolentis]